MFNENQFNKTIMTATAPMNDYDYGKIYLSCVCIFAEMAFSLNTEGDWTYFLDRFLVYDNMQ